MNKNLLIETALLNFLQKHLKRRSPTGTIGTAARRALNKLMGRKPNRKLIKRMSFKDFSNDPGAFFDVPVMKEHKMNNLQNLIERIVESKVKNLLNEGNKANKRLKNKAIAAKGREIINRGEFSGFQGEEGDLKTGRIFNKPPYTPKVFKSFIDRRTGKIDPHTVRSSKRMETGKYSDPHLGKHRIKRRKEVPPTIYGPKGKLP